MTILSWQTLDVIRPIYPWCERTVHRPSSLTYGAGSGGYDIRLSCADDDMVFSPGAFYLASSYESFEMPNHLCAIVHDKSTWARQGLCVQNTVIEPGWCGFLTLELTNHSLNPIRLIDGVPIAQIIFHALDQPTHEPYVGRYQYQQAGPQPAITTWDE